MNSEPKSLKEQRIRNITHLYYSRKDVQDAIFEFSKNREVTPRYFEGFGKRPDSFQYKNDIFELVKKGATSFHCSEELWSDPLKVETGMNEKQLNELRTGWDLLIDIDSKYIDYSKIMAEIIIKTLKFHRVKNIGIKFSGSKGFHLIVPWKSFPKEINEIKTKDMFPEYPRIITQYIINLTKNELIEKISNLEKPNKYIKDLHALKEVMPDLILVSPRHLFRMPYSLHEKTALASVVLDADEIQNFELKDADPLKAKVKNFLPDSKEGEASELLMQALDWYKDTNKKSDTEKSYSKDFKPIKLDNLSNQSFPPCVQKILNGIEDGKKRSLFVLINLFRSVGMDKDELEKRISEWNQKNKPPLREGYIKAQLSWAYKRKPVLPPNCREYYKGIGVCIPDELCNIIKNPVNYTIRKTLSQDSSKIKSKK
jgi:DNA primase catalytic subunit